MDAVRAASEQLLHTLQHSNCSSQLLSEQSVEKLPHRLGWILQRLTLVAHRSAHTGGIQIKQVTDKVVWVLHFDPIRRHRFRRKILAIEGDDHARLAMHGGCEDMAVVGIGQSDSINQPFVSGDQALRHGFVHQLARPLKLLGFQVRAILQNSARPLIVDSIRPARAKTICQGETKKQIPKRRGVQHTCVVDRDEVRHELSPKTKFLGVCRKFVEGFLTHCMGTLAEFDQVLEQHSPMRSHFPEL